MHVAIRRYQLAESASVDEAEQPVKDEFIPIIKDMPGFLAYYWLDSGDGTITAVSIFEDRERAEEANSKAVDWTKETLASMAPNPPEIIAGEVRLRELNLPKLGIREVSE
jgi:hypothetical protein